MTDEKLTIAPQRPDDQKFRPLLTKSGMQIWRTAPLHKPVLRRHLAFICYPHEVTEAIEHRRRQLSLVHVKIGHCVRREYANGAISRTERSKKTAAGAGEFTVVTQLTYTLYACLGCEDNRLLTRYCEKPTHSCSRVLCSDEFRAGVMQMPKSLTPAQRKGLAESVSAYLQTTVTGVPEIDTMIAEYAFGRCPPPPGPPGPKGGYDPPGGAPLA